MKPLIKLVWPFRWNFALAVVALGLASLFTAALTATVKPLLDDVWGSPQNQEEESRIDRIFAYQTAAMEQLREWSEWLGVPPESKGVGSGGIDLTTPLPWALLVLFIYCLQATMDVAGTYLMGRVGLRVVFSLRQQLMNTVLQQSMRFFKAMDTGQILSRIQNDVGRIQAATSVKMGELVKEAAMALISIVAVFIISWQLSLTLLILVPLVGVPIAAFTVKVRTFAQRSQYYLGNLSSQLKEVVVGIDIVKAFSGEAFESRRLEEQNRQVLRYALRELLIVALTTPVIGFVSMVIILSFVCFGTTLIQTTAMTAGDFMVYLLFVYQLSQPIKRMARANSEIQQAVGVLPRIQEILNWENDILDPPDPQLPRHFPGVNQITFERVCFAYAETEGPVLREVSLQVHKGQVVALVGPSGSGKTTLVSLLPRFFDVTDGAVKIDGIDLRLMRKDDLRQLVALVSQDVVLFNASFHDNIAYGRPHISRALVEQAAEQAFSREFIEELPGGFDAIIGEAGTRLSGGQKQRISIARAILKDAPILILDEATSALDTESERIVQRALDNLMKDRTTFVVAHRLSTIRRADLILVLEAGRIVERGTHDELMSRGTIYSKMIELQEGAEGGNWISALG